MTVVRCAAIYARISQDSTGEGLGVQRQLEDCRKLAKARGWVVAEEYVDNDISAYSGKLRPAYGRMLADIEAGTRDAVIVYHQDRLTRRPIEFEQFAELCQRVGTVQFASVTSVLRFGNDDDLFTARVLSAVAANESARKSARTKRRIQQKAEAGLPNGGNRRPFGYERDRMTVIEAEAQLIRGAVDRFLARESMVAIMEWFTDQGVPTVDGGTWRTVTVRQMITNPRIAGWRVHNGERVARAAWPALIEDDTFERVLAEHARRKESGWRPARRHLLSGMLRCGKCGNPLFSTSRESRRLYRCMSSRDHGGCGGITISALPAEEWLAAAVLLRLDTPDMQAALDGEAREDDRHAVLLAERESAERKMDELMLMWTRDEISIAEYRTGRGPLEKRIRDAQRQLDQLAGSRRLSGLAGQGSTLRAEWVDLPLTRQAAVVSAVLDFATIMPSGASHTVDPDRIVPTWRL